MKKELTEKCGFMRRRAVFVLAAITSLLIAGTFLPARAQADNCRAKTSMYVMEKVSVGMWGGEHIGLWVAENGARVEYDCARGTIDEPLSLDANGNFKVKGVHIREHGGPERPGERLDSHPARYVGKVDDNMMTLTVTLTDTNETIGNYTLTFGRDPLVRKCL